MMAAGATGCKRVQLAAKECNLVQKSATWCNARARLTRAARVKRARSQNLKGLAFRNLLPWRALGESAALESFWGICCPGKT